MNRAVWGYTGLFLLSTAACVRLLFEGTALIALGLAFLGIILFLVYFFQSGETMKGLFSRRSTLEGGNVLGVSLFVLGSLVLVNLIGAKVYWWQDLTADRLFTLSPETQSVLSNMEEAPQVTIFYLDGSPRQNEMRALMDAVQMEFPSVRGRFIDPEKNPREVSQYNVRKFCSVMEVGERREEFTGTDEASFVTALLRARSEVKPRIAFLQGHGEPVMTRGGRGYLQALVSLGERGFEASAVELARGDTLGAEYDVLWVANPEIPLSTDEQVLVERYLGNGGSLMLMLDPASPVAYKSILSLYGLEFIPEFIHDPDQQNPERVMAQDVSTHESTRELSVRNISVVLPGVGQVRRTRNMPAVYVSYLMWTGGKARLTPDPSGQEAQRAMALAITTKTKPVTRMILVGDADFAKNRDYSVLGNADFFLSSLRWLSEDTEFVSVTPRDITNRPVVLTRQQGRAFTVLFVVLLPLGVVASGTVVWWRRR